MRNISLLIGIDKWAFAVRFGMQICFLKGMQTRSYIFFLSSRITADARSYGCSNIFKRCFEDYGDAKENACCTYGNILSVLVIDREISAFAAVLLLLSLLYSSVFNLCVDPCIYVNLPSQVALFDACRYATESHM